MKICLTLLTLLSAAPGLLAQGAGLVGSNGLEPSIEVSHVRVLAPTSIRIRQLVPGLGTLTVAISPEPANVDLTTAGFPGAVLGVSLAPLTGPLILITGLDVPPEGEVVLPFVLPQALLGASIYIQAVNQDPGAPIGGAAISDARVVTFGATDDRLIVSSGPTQSSQNLSLMFADGQQTGPVLPTLDGIQIEAMTLTSSHDTLALTNESPVVDSSDPLRPRILLPGGGRLYRYARPSGNAGLFVVRDQGRTLQWLVESTTPMDFRIAASPFEPLIALVVDGAAGQFGGAELLLARTDGTNFAGTASPLHPVLFTGSLSGFNLKAQSMTFIDRALVFTDSFQVVRVPTDGSGPATSVLLPPSGGLPVSDVDRLIAWSLDGTTAALTAGQSPLARDVYLIQASGPGVNVTQNSGEYDDVGYQDLQDGGSLGLAPDGSQVAFIKMSGGSKEIFIQQAIPGAIPIQLTGPALFASTIDQDVGIWMVAPSRVTFHAGSNGLNQDVYRCDLSITGANPPTVMASNLTGTSGVLTPPFGTGAGLQAEAMAQVPGGGIAYVMNQGPGSDKRLIWSDGGAGGSSFALPPFQSLLAAPTSQGPLVILQRSSSAQVVRLTSGAAPSSVYQAVPGESLTGLIASAGDNLALLRTAQGGVAGARVLLADGSVLPVSGLFTEPLAAGGTFTGGGALILADSLGRIFNITLCSGVATQVGSTPDLFLTY